MRHSSRKVVEIYGIQVLLDTHPEIQKLRRVCQPTEYGDSPWTANWVLMNYLRHHRIPEDICVMDIGCGWGLTGIYCAKAFNARVVSVDVDPEVFPYLKLHARANHVAIDTINKDFCLISDKDLAPIDLVIGSDICYLHSMVKPLKQLIHRALKAQVRQVLICDRGRPPFVELSEGFLKEGKGEDLRWTTYHPYRTQGQILRIGRL